MFSIKIFFVVFLLLVNSYLFAQEKSDIIEKIEIVGNERIDLSTIQSYVTINIGSKFDALSLNDAIKSLYSTDLFSEISFKRENGALIIIVKENPVINRIAFEGNQRIEDEDILAEIYLKPRTVFTKTKVKNDLERLRTLYRRSGRFAAKIEPKIIILDQNRLDLVFEIDEGPLTKISNIQFIGNKSFSDSKLRREMLLKEKAWWRIMSSSDRYDPDILGYDRESIRRFYVNSGFVDIDITSISSELKPERDTFHISMVINEGTRYKFGNIGGELHIDGVNPQLIKEKINIEKGKWYNAQKLDRVVSSISENIMKNGFSFVEVFPELTRKENDTIDVKFIIREGVKTYVNRINIIGND